MKVIGNESNIQGINDLEVYNTPFSPPQWTSSIGAGPIKALYENENNLKIHVLSRPLINYPFVAPAYPSISPTLSSWDFSMPLSVYLPFPFNLVGAIQGKTNPDKKQPNQAKDKESKQVISDIEKINIINKYNQKLEELGSIFAFLEYYNVETKYLCLQKNSWQEWKTEPVYCFENI